MDLLRSTRGAAPTMRPDLFAMSAQLNFSPVSQRHHKPPRAVRLVSHFTVPLLGDPARFPVPTAVPWNKFRSRLLTEQGDCMWSKEPCARHLDD